MAKLTKAVRKLHDQAMVLLNRGDLTPDEREFCYVNLRPDATTDIGKGSAFFTPWEIAMDFQIETLNVNDDQTKTIIDLCAGFGILSYKQWARHWGRNKPKVTCVEINPEYVAIGKKLFPEATWICADVFDVPTMDLGRFDEFYSNPPFGTLPARLCGTKWARSRFEYVVAELGMTVADYGTMIVQSGITDWKMSGQHSFSNVKNAKYDAWVEQSGLRLAHNCGIDCSHTPFAETGVVVEIANVMRAEDCE